MRFYKLPSFMPSHSDMINDKNIKNIT